MKGILTRKSTLFPIQQFINIRLFIMLFLLITAIQINAQIVYCPDDTNLDAMYCESNLPSTVEEVQSPPYNLVILGADENTRVHINIDTISIPNCDNPVLVIEREIIIYNDNNFTFQYEPGEEIATCIFYLNCPQDPIAGCPYEEALNYNPNANCDDGSCSYKNCHIDDWTALKALYESTSFNGENDIDPWWDEMFESDTPLPTCNLSNPFSVDLDSTGRVSEMRLSNYGFVGTIPSEFEKLSNLTLLDLSGNQLTGNIPASLGNLENLSYLDLSSNQLVGSLPGNLVNLINLVFLDLAFNNLSGCYSAEFVKFCDIDGFGSVGNNFAADWDDFCYNGEGTCPCDNFSEASKEEHYLCENETITIDVENGNIDNESESELVYLLHNGYGSIGDTVDINTTGFYINDGTFDRGKQLYVSPVIGPSTGENGFPDIENPCTFVAFPGTPIFFVEPIMGTSDGGCDGQEYYISYSFSGGFGEQFEISGSLTEIITSNETAYGSFSLDEETFMLIATDEVGCSATITGDIICPCYYPTCYIQDPPSACDDENPCTENDVEILDACTGIPCVPCEGTPINCECEFISGELFVDLNANACNDDETAGVAGVEVIIWECDPITGEPGMPIGSTITGDDGDYIFGGGDAPFECILDPLATYTIQIEIPAGYVFSDGVEETCPQNETNDVFTNGMSNCIPLNDDGNNHLHLDAGLVPSGSITGFVGFVNNDDIPDQPIAEVSIELLDAMGNVLSTTLTNMVGVYEFTNLLPGDYIVFQVQPMLYTDVTEGDFIPDATDPTGPNDMPSDNQLPVTLIPGELDEGNNFIEEIPCVGCEEAIPTDCDDMDPCTESDIESIVTCSDGSIIECMPCAGTPIDCTCETISGKVFIDTNNNGCQDASEIGAEGIEVTLFVCDVDQIATVTTDQDGNYTFGGETNTPEVNCLIPKNTININGVIYGSVYGIWFNIPEISTYSNYSFSSGSVFDCAEENTDNVSPGNGRAISEKCYDLSNGDELELINAGIVPVRIVTVTCPEITDLGTFDCTNIGEVPLSVNTKDAAMAPPYNLSIEEAVETTRVTTLDSDVIFYCEEDARTVIRTIIIYDDENMNLVYDFGEEIGSCDFFINTIPDITAPTFIAPPDFNANCNEGYDPNVTGIPVADDTCPGNSEILYSDEIIDDSCLGEFIVTRFWTATDPCGNLSEPQAQIITVECIEDCADLEFCNGNIGEQIFGCTEQDACNYDPMANCDDGSCIFFDPEIRGCTNPDACNYSPEANCDDGSCIIVPICNSDPCEGDITTLSMDGCTCEVVESQVLGCTDEFSSNYNPGANCDDGSCVIFDLALIKEISTSQPTPIYPGDDVTFTISVFNQGNITATNFTITDYIPAGMILNDADWTAGDINATITMAGPLAPSSSTSIDITLTYNSTTAGNLINYAEISSATAVIADGQLITDIDSTPDNNPDNDVSVDNTIDNENGDEDDHDFALITVDAFDLAISKDVAPGTPATLLPNDNVTFVITVFNQGSITAQNIDLVDYIPVGLTLNDVNWMLEADGPAINSISGPIAPGASASVNITFTIDPGFSGQIRNVVEIAGAEDPNGNIPGDIDSTPRNGDNGEDDVDDEIINVAVFDLALTKTLADGQPSLFVPEDNVIFTITVFNQGTVAAKNIEIIDHIPVGLILNDADWTTGDNNTATTILAGPIAAGSSASVNITLTVETSETVSLTNFAEITSAQDSNGNVTNDIDSINDNDQNNDNIIDDVIDNSNGDEDDSDIEVIAVDCSNYAGTVPQIARFICEGETGNVISTGAVLPPGIGLFYVLHNEADTFGEIIAINRIGIFVNDGTYPRDIQYYVSAIVAEEDDDGTPNFDDPCMDITLPGTPVVFLNPISWNINSTSCNVATGISTINYSFEGGLPAFDGSAYEVSTTFGDFVAVPGANSFQIPKGIVNYTITLSDGQGCTAFYEGENMCEACNNDPGLPNPAQYVCVGDTANGETNDPVIDRGILAYILHDGTDSIGTIIGTNYTGQFTNDGTYPYNTQYYISAVVGQLIGEDTIPNFEQPCTKFSRPGTPVFFVEPITSYSDATCNETYGETTIIYSFSGGFGSVFEISSNDTNNTINSGDTATLILQTGNGTYQLLATDEQGCMAGITVIYDCGEEGCTDPCSGNYNSEATLDDDSCEPYDNTCNTECLEGDITVWDEMTCSCIIESIGVLGCTDETACNYNPDANCDDGSCKPYPFCNTEPCEGDVTELNAECECDLFEPQVIGCTDFNAVNYMPDANCDDGSCIPIDFKLLLKKELSTPPPYLPGDTITYTLSIENEGNIAASNIEVTDIVPDGLTFDNSVLNNLDWNFANDTATTTIADTLAAGDSLKVDITFIIEDTPPENITNLGEISKAKDTKDNDYPNEDNEIEPETEKPDNEVPIEVANRCHRQDVSALRDFYLNTNGADWVNRQGWEIFDNESIPQDCDLSTFHGIGVDDDFRVDSINLSRNNLSDTILVDLDLPYLVTLDLSYNQLSGNIPLFENLTNLAFLYLNNNYFTGEIPPSHDQLPLQVVDVSVNLLEGEIPKYNMIDSLSVDSNRYWFNEIRDYLDYHPDTSLTEYSPQFYGDTLVITKDSATYVIIDNVLSSEQQQELPASDFDWIKYNPYVGTSSVNDGMFYEIENIQPSDAGRHHLHITDEDIVPGLEMVSLPIHLFVTGYDEIGAKSEEGEVIFEGELPDSLSEFVIDSCACNRGLYLLQMETDSAANKLIIKINTEEETGYIRGDVDDIDDVNGIGSKNYPFGQDAIINDGPVFRYNLLPHTIQGNIRLFILDTGLDIYSESFDEVLFDEAPLDLCYQIPKAPGYGYIDTLVTVDYQDFFGHGTYGSWSIIEDMTENIDLVPLKVFNKDKQGKLFKMICALYHAIDHGANIVNISAGYKGTESLVLRNAIQNAAREKIFVVAAAGNDSTNIDLKPQYPAAFAADDSLKNVISVVSIDSNNELSFFSNYSPTFESIAAYGENIEGYGLERACIVANGTSISTYFVSKALSLELVKDTSRSIAQVSNDFRKNMLVPDLKLMDAIKNGLRLNTDLERVADDNKCCYTPFVVIQDQVDCHTASFRWDDLLVRQHYTIRYRRLNDTINFDGKHPRYCDPSEWITITRFESNVTLERLSEDSMYEVQFQTICNNKVSSFSEPIFFKTNKVEDCQGNFKGITNLQVLLYPNPTQDYLNLFFTNFNKEEKKLNLQISDSNGKIVQSEIYAIEPEGNSYCINVSHLASGLYYLLFYDENFSIHYKVVIL